MFLLAEPLWLRKITTESHILAHVNTVCPDDRDQKLKISTSELIFAPPLFFLEEVGDFTWRSMVYYCRRFGTKYWSHLKVNT